MRPPARMCRRRMLVTAGSPSRKDQGAKHEEQAHPSTEVTRVTARTDKGTIAAARITFDHGPAACLTAALRAFRAAGLRSAGAAAGGQRAAALRPTRAAQAGFAGSTDRSARAERP